NSFAFDAPRVQFGAGSSADTGEQLRYLGVSRALIVCDAFVARSGLAERFQSSLRSEGIESVVDDDISGEPTEARVLHAVEAARDRFDGFVGVGGGSALDTAKLCA